MNAIELEYIRPVLDRMFGPTLNSVRIVTSPTTNGHWLVAKYRGRQVMERLDLPNDLSMDRHAMALAESVVAVLTRISMTERPAAAYIKA